MEIGGSGLDIGYWRLEIGDWMRLDEMRAGQESCLRLPKRGKIILQFFKKKLLTSKIRAVRILFMVEQQAT